MWMKEKDSHNSDRRASETQTRLPHSHGPRMEVLHPIPNPRCQTKTQRKPATRISVVLKTSASISYVNVPRCPVLYTGDRQGFVYSPSTLTSTQCCVWILTSNTVNTYICDFPMLVVKSIFNLTHISQLGLTKYIYMLSSMLCFGVTAGLTKVKTSW